MHAKLPETEYDEKTYSGISARVRVLARMQKVAKLLLACGPGDFLGKKEYASLARRYGREQLAKQFEQTRDCFYQSFQPILSELSRELPQPLPWLKWHGLHCGKDEVFEFALIHACTVAARELFPYRESRILEQRSEQAESHWLLRSFDSIKIKTEAKVTLAALEFDTPSRQRVQAKAEAELDGIAKIFDFRTAQKAEEILKRPARTIESTQPSWLQRIFLDFWDEFPKNNDGNPICDCRGFPMPPLCLFDDKSTRQIIHMFAKGSSRAAASVTRLGDDAINKTWRRLGLVRARKPLFFTQKAKPSK